MDKTNMPVNAQGTTIEIGSPAVAVARVKSIGGPKQSRESIDVTTLDSTGGYREFIGGFRDGGEVSVSGFFIYSDGGQKAVIAAFDSEEAQAFKVKFPKDVGAQWSFDGVVIDYEVGSEVGDAITFSATIKVSGKPVLEDLDDDAE